MDNFQFNNKIMIDNSKVIIGTIVRVLCLIIAIVLLLTLGLRGTSMLIILIPLLLLNLVIPRGPAVYNESVVTTISLENGLLKIVYKDLDRHDNLGVRTEEYIIAPMDIRQISYNEQYNKLSIVSKAQVRIISDQQEIIEKDYRNSNDYAENVIYPTEEIRDSMLEFVKKICQNHPKMNLQ